MHSFSIESIGGLKICSVKHIIVLQQLTKLMYVLFKPLNFFCYPLSVGLLATAILDMPVVCTGVVNDM